MKRTGATAGMSTAMTPGQLTSGSLFERAVEQGARLIASPPGHVDIVLQMPRGNLESISHRFFVLQEILLALKAADFKSAWQKAIVNRADLNILVDFNWPQFLEQTEQFISAVSSSEEICELMTALRRGCLFEAGSPYSECLAEEWSCTEEARNLDKVTTVCEALRSAMTAIDSDLYCKAIVLSYARCDPPDLENALLCVKSARMEELKNGSDNSEGSSAGEALKHLMLYVETTDLYRVALGMYDLGLAYMIITHAQRDPGEYMIELEQFSALEPESYRYASIDRHLNRFSRALTHLVAAGEGHLEEAIELAAEHQLFHELLAKIDPAHAQRSRVLLEYGHWLKEKGMQEDAGAAFMAAHEPQLALEAYQNSGEWQMAFILAGKLRYTEVQMADLASDIAEELRSMERFADAAQVYAEYLGDSETAVSLLTDARQWREALRLSHRSQREDLVESVIAPAAAAAVTSHIQHFTSQTESVGKYSERLQDVQRKRLAMEQTVGHTGMDEATEGVSTVAGLSLYTDRTHVLTTRTSTGALTRGGKKPKTRRKAKKPLKIKQGSPQEEAALVEHLQQLRPESHVLEEVSQLNSLLLFLGFFDDGQKLQTTLDALLKNHAAAVEACQIPQRETIGFDWKLDVLRGAI